MLAVPTIMFAYTCQVNVFSIYQELQRPTTERINKVGVRSCFLSCILYAMIGVFGFLRFSHQKYDWDKCNGNILNNYQLEPSGGVSDCTKDDCWNHISFGQLLKSPVIVAGEAAITLTILLAFPLNIFPCRYTLEMMMSYHAMAAEETEKAANEKALLSSSIEEHLLSNGNGVDAERGPSQISDTAATEGDAETTTAMGWFRHIGLTALIVGLAMLVAIFLPNIQVVFSLLGSTTSAFVCFIVPGMFVLKVEDGPWYSRGKLPAALLVAGGVITGIACTGVIVYTNWIQ